MRRGKQIGKGAIVGDIWLVRGEKGWEARYEVGVVLRKSFRTQDEQRVYFPSLGKWIPLKEKDLTLLLEVPNVPWKIGPEEAMKILQENSSKWTPELHRQIAFLKRRHERKIREAEALGIVSAEALFQELAEKKTKVREETEEEREQRKVIEDLLNKAPVVGIEELKRRAKEAAKEPTVRKPSLVRKARGRSWGRRRRRRF